MGREPTVEEEISQFPAALRRLIDAELQAGNRVTEIGHSYPAPPIGAYAMLAQVVSTRPRGEDGELTYRSRNSSTCSGEFSTPEKVFFVLEPPGPPPEMPDMDAIREAVNCPAPGSPTEESLRAQAFSQIRSFSDDVERFRQSMQIDYEKWREGTGYDLSIIRHASPTSRQAIEDLLLSHEITDWRDIEALAEFDSTRVREAIRAARHHPKGLVRQAVLSHGAKFLKKTERHDMLLDLITTATIGDGLTQTLSMIEDHHPNDVIDALFEGLLDRPGDVACHYAGMLYYLHGVTTEPFAWSERPVFLSFNTPSKADRLAAFRKLCERLKVDPERYLKNRTA